MFDIILAMTIHILVIDGAFDVGLTAILDTLSLANEHLLQSYQSYDLLSKE